jgi:G3E family GTPase
MGIESSVMRDAEGNPIEDLYELENGCICCSVKDSFVATVERIVDLRKDITRIVVEATGLADPVPIVNKFWLDDELESSLLLDGVIVLVDLKHFQALVDSQHRALYLQQLSLADCILLNKADLVDQGLTEAVKEQVTQINPLARLILYCLLSTERARAPLDQIFGCSSLRDTGLVVPVEPLSHHLKGVGST